MAVGEYQRQAYRTFVVVATMINTWLMLCFSIGVVVRGCSERLQWFHVFLWDQSVRTVDVVPHFLCRVMSGLENNLKLFFKHWRQVILLQCTYIVVMHLVCLVCFVLAAVISTNWMCSTKRTEALLEVMHMVEIHLWLIRLPGWNNKLSGLKAYAIIKPLKFKVCPSTQ